MGFCCKKHEIFAKPGFQTFGYIYMYIYMFEFVGLQCGYTLQYKLCVSSLNEAQNDVPDFKCEADMKLEQCHRHNNGSLACPQTCEDLNPEQEGDCRR